MAIVDLCCVTSVSLSVLVNGSPTEPFNGHKGLRQGDPISFFLFSIITEVINFVARHRK